MSTVPSLVPPDHEAYVKDPSDYEVRWLDSIPFWSV
jgi:hypothetical protein